MLSGSTVDACTRCRGLWVDWFDGELVAVVKETAPLSVRTSVPFEPREARCPRCGRTLAAETVSGTIVLLRCGECAGSFVPRESFTLMLDLEGPALSRVDAGAAERSAWQRLLAAIRKLFHTTDIA